MYDEKGDKNVNNNNNIAKRVDITIICSLWLVL